MATRHEPSIGVFKNTFRRVEASYETIGIPELLGKTILSGHIDSNPYLSAIVACPLDKGTGYEMFACKVQCVFGVE